MLQRKKSFYINYLVIFLIAFQALNASEKVKNITASMKLLQKSCVDCHDEDVQKGNLRLDNLISVKDDPHSMHTWLEVYDKVSSGEMPPKKKAFSKEQKKAFLEGAFCKISN